MPKQGVAFTFYTELVDAADTTLFKLNPTIAAGDVQISLAGGTFANLTNLPTVTPAGSTQVKVELTAAEMAGADRTVQFHDAVGGEWLDQAIHITADEQAIDDLATSASIAALNDLSAAEVNAEVVDALSTVDKTGYKLASDGLDSVSITAPSGVASNFREMVVQLWRRFFKKATMTSSALSTYADDGVSVLTTQELSDDGTVQTQGESL